MKVSRRTFLQVAGAGAAAAAWRWPMFRAVAGPGSNTTDEFFVFIHAAGGWDVTLWADPRNEKKGIVDPATTDVADLAGLKHFMPAPSDVAGAQTFELVRPPGSNLVFGPAIGDL